MRTPARVLAASLVLAAASLVAAACGSSGASKHSGVVPRDALAVALLDTRSGDGSPRQQVLDDLGRVPAFALATQGKIPTDSKIVSYFEQGADEAHRVTWARDVKPWLGRHIGAALLGVDVSRKGAPTVGYFAFADSTDDAKATAAMKRGFGHGAAGSSHGTPVYWGEPDGSAGTRNYWAVADGHVIVSLHRADVVAALDAVHGDSLEQTDQWKQLTASHRGTDPLAGVLLTSHFFPAYAGIVRDLGSQSPQAAKALRSASSQLDMLKGIHASIAVRAGASTHGLWVDASTHGALPVGGTHKSSSSTAPRKALDALPASTIAGAAASAADHPDANTLTYANESMKAMQQSLTEAAKADPSVRPFVQLVGTMSQLLSGDLVTLAGQAFDSASAVGVVAADDGRLGLVAQRGVKDAAAADTYLTRVVGILDAALAPYHLNAAVGGTPTSRTVTISGIPAGKLRDAIAKGGGAAALARPLVAEFLVPKVTIGVDTVGDTAVATVPAGIVSADAPTLGGTDRYERDLKAAGAPSHTDALMWMDAAAISRAIFDAVSPQATPVVTGQLDHVGGPVAWSTHEGSGKDASTSFVLELPIYE